MKSNRRTHAAFALVGLMAFAAPSLAQTRIRTGPEKGTFGHPWPNTTTTKKNEPKPPSWYPRSRQQAAQKAKVHEPVVQPKRTTTTTHVRVLPSKANPLVDARHRIVTPSHNPKHVVVKKWNHGQQVSAQRHAANAIRKAEKHERWGNESAHGRKHDDHDDHHKDWGKHR